jgi:hypothetical protein
MSHAKLSRRAILAGTAAVSATAIAATPTRASWTTPAVVDATSPDPIFAEIEKYRATNTAFIALCHHEESLENAGHELIAAPSDFRTPEMVATVTASAAARERLSSTSPTSLTSLAAYLDFVQANSDDEQFVFDGEEETLAFVCSLLRAVRGIVAEQAVRS